MDKFVMSFLLGVLFTFGSYGIAVGLGWTTIANISIIEVIAVFTSYVCTYLCVVQSRWNYPIGAVSIALYAWMFFTSGLFASMALQFYLFPVMVYGWYRWNSDANTRPVTSVFKDSWWWIAIYAFVILASYGGVYNINMYFHGNMAIFDTWIFVASIFAQFLMDNKKIENWFIWFGVNVLSLYVYWNAGLYLIFIQYLLFLFNTAYGYYRWNVDRPNKTIFDDTKFGRNVFENTKILSLWER